MDSISTSSLPAGVLWRRLAKAICDDDLRAAKACVKAGVDLEIRDAVSGGTALHDAVGEGRDAIIDLLITSGADVNARDKDGWTPLFVALSEARLPQIKKLLDSGADINARDADGSPLIVEATRWAVDNEPGRQALALLLERFVDVNLTEPDGTTALMWAGWYGDVAVIRMLVEVGADATMTNESGLTAYWFADTRGHKEAASLLAEAEIAGMPDSLQR